MVKILPYDKDDPQRWKQSNEDALQKINDGALKVMIRTVLNLHEREQSGSWKKAHRHLDYSESTFEAYLRQQMMWSLSDLRLLEEAIFDHLEEVKVKGLDGVLQRLKKLKGEKITLPRRK